MFLFLILSACICGFSRRLRPKKYLNTFSGTFLFPPVSKYSDSQWNKIHTYITLFITDGCIPSGNKYIDPAMGRDERNRLI